MKKGDEEEKKNDGTIENIGFDPLQRGLLSPLALLDDFCRSRFIFSVEPTGYLKGSRGILHVCEYGNAGSMVYYCGRRLEFRGLCRQKLSISIT